jgi:hypothetical protein
MAAAMLESLAGTPSPVRTANWMPSLRDGGHLLALLLLLLLLELSLVLASCCGTCVLGWPACSLLVLLLEVLEDEFGCDEVCSDAGMGTAASAKTWQRWFALEASTAARIPALRRHMMLLGKKRALMRHYISDCSVKHAAAFAGRASISPTSLWPAQQQWCGSNSKWFPQSSKALA